MTTPAARITVAEFFEALRRPRPRRAGAQLGLIQAAVDRGWAYHDPDSAARHRILGSKPKDDELSKGAEEVFVAYHRLVLFRPAICVWRNAYVWGNGVNAVTVSLLELENTGFSFSSMVSFYEQGLGRTHYTLGEVGWRALLARAAEFAVLGRTGLDIGMSARHGLHVAIAAADLELFVRLLKDTIEEHVIERHAELPADEEADEQAA